MPAPNSTSSLHQLSTICDDNLSLHAKIALLTISKPDPSLIFEKIILSIEYLQLFTPLLISAIHFQHSQETWLPNALFLIAKLLNPGYWISFSHVDAFSIIILSLIFALIASKLLLFFWIAYQLACNSQPFPILIKIWRIIFRLQGKVTCFYITSFLVNALTIPESHYRNRPFIVASVFLITLEFAFSVFLTIFYKNSLPTKSLLSAKNNHLEIFTLLQKFILQLFLILLPSSSWTWVFPIFNVFCDRVRQVWFLKTFPLYNFKALIFQGCFLVCLSSFDLACLALAVMKSVDHNSSSLLTLLILWLMFFLLSIKIFNGLLYKTFWKIVVDPSVTSPDLLIHRIPLVQQLIYHKKDNKWTFLLNQAFQKHILTILKIDNSIENPSMNSFFKQYLEKLLLMHPKDQLLKLYAAKFFAKKFNIYGDSIKMAKNIKKHGTWLLTLQAEFLLIEIQNQIKKQAQQKDQLDVSKYIREQTFLAQLKLGILKQANLQIETYKELKKERPDLAFILENSQKTKIKRNNITFKMTQLTQKISEYNIEPFLLFAQYHLILNHSLGDYLTYAKIYQRELQKYFKAFEEESLNEENMFQNTTEFYLISGQKRDLGKILFSSKNTKGTGALHLNQIIPFYENFSRNLTEDTQNPFFNKIMRGFVYDENGFLTEVDYCFNVHPHVTQGFYFTLLFRPVISNRDAIYVLENGDIDCITKSFHDQLGRRITNIHDISEELTIANNVFNFIEFPERSSIDLSKEKIHEIYKTFTTEGAIISLKSSKQTHLKYHCRIQNQIIDSTTVVKILIFEQVTSKEQKKVQPSQSISPLLMTQKDNSVDFTFDEEKDQGWFLNHQQPLHYRKMTSAQRSLPTDNQENTTTRTLLESSPSRNIQKATERNEKEVSTFPILSTPNLPDIQDKEHPDHVPAGIPTSLTPTSPLSQQRKISNNFKKALETPYSSKISRVLILIFYIALIILIASQIILSSALNTNTIQLQVKKEFLRNFQARNSITITIGGSLRNLQEAENGLLNTTGLVLFMGGSQILRSFSSQFLAQLSNLNQYILHHAENIEENVRSLLFEPNVPIYDTYFDEPEQSYLNLSTLQATDRIIETGFMLVTKEDLTTPKAIQAANFFFRNTANDLIIQNQKIAGLLTDLFLDQREKIERIISIYFSLLTSIFMMILVVFAFLMRKQYKKEKRNLLALCQINNKQIDNLIQNSVRFKEEIGSQKSFGDSSTCFTLKGETRKNPKKTPNLTGIKRKYFIYYAKLLVIISLFTSLVIASSIAAQHTIDNFQDEQEQISFIDNLKTRTTLSMQAYGELLTTNNIALVENCPAFKELLNLQNELQDIKEKIYNTLLTKNTLEHNSYSKAFLLDESCDLLNPILYSIPCQVLASSGKKTGIVYLLNELEDVMKKRVQEYKASDKSLASRMEIKRNDYNLLVAIYQVLMAGEESLANLINERLEEEIKKSGKMRRQILGVFVGVGVVLGCLSWICLWRKLKKGVSEFQNVLKVFPAEVILTSFLLRNFLVKTSKNKIDFIKN